MIVPKAFYLSFRCFPILLPKLALLYAFPESSAKGKVTCTTCKNAGVIMCDNTLSEFYYYYSWLPHLIDFCRPLCPACFFFSPRDFSVMITHGSLGKQSSFIAYTNQMLLALQISSTSHPHFLFLPLVAISSIPVGFTQSPLYKKTQYLHITIYKI